MKDLTEIIKQNPGAVAIVDNDCWTLYREHPHNAPDGDAEFEAWEKDNLLAQEGDVIPRGDGGYGSGSCYGGDILQALAEIVGIKIESV